jgi:hypothetical protein
MQDYTTLYPRWWDHRCENLGSNIVSLSTCRDTDCFVTFRLFLFERLVLQLSQSPFWLNVSPNGGWTIKWTIWAEASCSFLYTSRNQNDQYVPCGCVKLNFLAVVELRWKIGPFYHRLIFQGFRGICRSQGPKAWTAFARSNTGILCSNPTRGIDVCARLFCVNVVLCVGSGLATGWFPVHGVLPTVYGLRNWKSGQGPQAL